MNYGKTTLYFPNGSQFLVTGTIEIGGPVLRLMGLKSKIIGNGGTLKLVDTNEEDAPVVHIERFSSFGAGNTLRFEHNSIRVGVISNMGGLKGITGNGSGDLFIEDCTSWEVRFNNSQQHIWARQLNAEGNEEIKVLNEGATLWILGFKTENPGLTLSTVSNGKTELIGALIYRVALTNQGYQHPMFNITDACATFAGIAEYSSTGDRKYQFIVSESRENDSIVLQTNNIDAGRHNGSAVMHLFSGCNDALLNTTASPQSPESKLHLYPNPAIEVITVDIPSIPYEKQILIYDVFGRLVESKHVEANSINTQININHLKSGLYILKWNDRSVKFIKK